MEKIPFDIYESSMIFMGVRYPARYLGFGEGRDFLEACRDYVKNNEKGEIRFDAESKTFYGCSETGTRWYPTLEEAERGNQKK